jgi:hypothetical protein
MTDTDTDTDTDTETETDLFLADLKAPEAPESHHPCSNRHDQADVADSQRTCAQTTSSAHQQSKFSSRVCAYVEEEDTSKFSS